MDRFVFDPSWLGDVPPPRRPLLLFDGGCPFCRAAARLIARLDRCERLALLSRDAEAAALYASRIPDDQFAESWQLIEPTGVRLMHGPAAVRLLGYLPATRWLASLLRSFKLTPVATAVNRVLGKIRKPLARFFCDSRVPHRWP
jgi:predicted DCC family thiol-disulfide oxidoreductase YuxK